MVTGRPRRSPTNGHGSTPAARAAAVGAVAGTAAVWAMDQVGWWLYRHEDPAALRRELAARPDGPDSAHLSARKLGRLIGRDPGGVSRTRPGLPCTTPSGRCPARCTHSRDAVLGVVTDRLIAMTAASKSRDALKRPRTRPSWLTTTASSAATRPRRAREALAASSQ